MTKEEALPLLETARDAAQQAHAPYSNFHVGAALRCSSGRIFKGCNVENASYGLTNCAERTAVFSAIAAGEKKFAAMAIVADGAIPYPCGACRQVLSEFCPPDFPVLIAPANNLEAYKATTMQELLPLPFELQ
jgi:cytidine deaminase